MLIASNNDVTPSTTEQVLNIIPTIRLVLSTISLTTMATPPTTMVATSMGKVMMSVIVAKGRSNLLRRSKCNGTRMESEEGSS